MSDLILKNKTAFVTGSSRGIGKQIAYALAQLGSNLIIHARTKENLSGILKLLDKTEVKCYTVVGDLSEFHDVQKIIEVIQSENLNVDILYNNAGIGTPYKANIFTHSWGDWERCYRINVQAMYSFMAAFIPGMLERKFGRIINITSGIKNQPQLTPYGASKAAVDKLTEDFAFAMPSGVRINTLDPGWIRTDMGGTEAEHPVEAVIPGVLVPALIADDGPNGQFFSAINYDRELISKFNLENINPAMP